MQSPNQLLLDMAMTIFIEAGGETEAGMDYVADTFVNRAKLNRKYMGGKDYATILSTPQCYDGFKLRGNRDASTFTGPNKQAYQYALGLADRVLKGQHVPKSKTTHFANKRESFAHFEKPGVFEFTHKFNKHYMFVEY